MSRSARYAVKDNHTFSGGEPLSSSEMAPPRKSGAEPTLQSYRTIPENSRPTLAQPTPEEQIVDVFNNPIGIYGWRKYCLYASVLLLLCLAIINIGLAVFLMRVADIHSSGAGAARFESGLVRVEGVAEVTQGLFANNVTSFEENSLALLSTKKIVLQSNQSSALTLTDGLANFRVDNFQATYGTNNTPYFSASPDQVTVSANKMVVSSPSGMVVDGSVQAARIANMHANGAGLTIESLAQSMNVQAAQNLSVTSTDGSVTLSALTGVTLASSTSVTLSAPALILDGLLTVGTVPPFTLCVCDSGLLFRVSVLNGTCVSASPCP
eukprot:m.248269 g.248269  ORF g.248269 m.248269 type:complete len:324 (+) comp57914_c0_seq1:128-1099(+)